MKYCVISCSIYFSKPKTTQQKRILILFCLRCECVVKQRRQHCLLWVRVVITHVERRHYVTACMSNLKTHIPVEHFRHNLWIVLFMFTPPITTRAVFVWGADWLCQPTISPPHFSTPLSWGSLASPCSAVILRTSPRLNSAELSPGIGNVSRKSYIWRHDMNN